MPTDIRALAEAFSSHRFADVYDHLATDVVWVAVGSGSTEGRDAVIAVCESTLSELATTTTEFERFVSVSSEGVAAVDAVGRYTDADGGVSRVSSCDIYEVRGEQIARITSYTVELDAAVG
jgi:ketosteroid isomerase-like protein